MLGNFGAGGQQEHVREVCADLLWIFVRAQFSLAMLPFEVFYSEKLGIFLESLGWSHNVGSVSRAAPKRTSARGQTPICGFLRVPVVFCVFL